MGGKVLKYYYSLTLLALQAEAKAHNGISFLGHYALLREGRGGGGGGRK